MNPHPFGWGISHTTWGTIGIQALWLCHLVLFLFHVVCTSFCDFDEIKYQYADSAWGELKQIRKAIGFLVLHVFIDIKLVLFQFLVTNQYGSFHLLVLGYASKGKEDT